MSSKTTPANIITSTPYSDLTNTLTKSPTTSSPSASSSSARSERAMSATSTWQPKLDRRQSFSNEEYKHMMQARSGSTGGSGLSGVKKAAAEGFSEE
ncbi:hypothetical protein SMACR_04656 [Sordaria macrospora]|uniref:WGS project CABT00000000 data, contig 2.21 n=2 Tax=Sordaria macrospora TaxID=5147 RepID=F7W224_SORMK|nr:uncharacterized protein SMAC_04656 [Sordaria macrospora k-hell]KAA8624071.1 hypothetical protein SMACR_04656 [Sordaria macrospora]WPJ61928.1 hypothetical protein SMAC4_04656 [Sordaria macrospora]CCC11674.1 unnamed protein product [Sordaria macrospora k-hell]